MQKLASLELQVVLYSYQRLSEHIVLFFDSKSCILLDAFLGVKPLRKKPEFFDRKDAVSSPLKPQLLLVLQQVLFSSQGVLRVTPMVFLVS